MFDSNFVKRTSKREPKGVHGLNCGLVTARRNYQQERGITICKRISNEYTGTT
jgi:hypothetical protein